MIKRNDCISVATSQTPAGTTANHDFVFRRTCDLSLEQRQQFCRLFTRVFEKDMDVEAFERKYLKSPLGYSHHGFMLAEGRIVGAYNLVPYRYMCFGAPCLFGLSVDAMVDPAHRCGPFNLLKMARLVYAEAARDGVVFAFGFPNDQAYTFTRKILRWDDLGDLEFYALPVNVGAFRASLAWANPLSRLGAALWVHIPRRRRMRQATLSVEKVCDAAFREHRYNGQHKVLRLKHGAECTYRVYREDSGVNVLYIIDVMPLTAAAMNEAIRRLHRITASDIDLILYVGRLPFASQGLLRLPSSRRPRRIRMCGKILEPQSVDERVLQIRHWNINISNFDVR